MAKCDKTVAVIGVSLDETKYGFSIFRDILAQNCKVYGINPKGGTILEQKIYPSLADLPEVPQLVITVVPPAATEAIVDECIKLGINTIWMQPGSESDAAIDKAKAAGIAVTARACFMVKFGFW